MAWTIKKLPTQNGKAKNASLTGNYQTNKGQTALSSYQTPKQKETNKLTNPFGIDVLDRKFQETALELNDVRKRTGANYNPLEDAYNLTMEFAKDTLKSSNLIGTKNRNPLAVADNSYQKALQQKKWDYEYSVLSPEQKKQELEKLGYKSDKQVAAQNQKKVIDYAKQKGLVGLTQEEEYTARMYEDAARYGGGMGKVINGITGIGEAELTENGQGQINPYRLDAKTRQKYADEAAAIREKGVVTYEKADQALQSTPAYQFAKDHPGDLGGYENMFSNISGIAEKVKNKGIDSLTDKEQEVYYYAAGQMDDLDDISSGKLAGWGANFAGDLQKVNGMITAYEPTEQQKYLLGMYRNTLEGAKEWADEAQGTDEEGKAQDNYYFVNNREKAKEISTDPSFQQNSIPKADFSSGNAGLDRYYKIINNINNEQQMADLHISMSGGQDDALNFAYNLDDEEKGVFNALMHDGKTKEAQEYLDYMRYAVDERIRKKTNTAVYNLGASGPGGAVAASVLSVPASIARGVGYLDILGQRVANDIRGAIGGEYKPININGSLQLPGDVADSARQAVMDTNDWNINVLGRDTDLFDFLYGTGMDTANSIAAGATGFGGALLGLGAAQQTTQDVYERGGNDRQALIMGTVAGIFETLFENWSIGEFYNELDHLGKRSPKEAITNILAQAGINFSEEFNTELADYLADQAIMGDKSEQKNKWNEYIRLGMTPEEANARTAEDLAWRLAQAGFGGALMGGVFGATSNLVSDVRTGSVDRKTGSVIKKDTLTTMVDLAEQLGGEAGKTAQKINVDKANNRQTGELARTIFNQLGGKDRGTLIARMAVDLQDADISRDAAESIALMMAGQELGPEEIQALARDEKAMDVLYTALGQKEGTPKQKQQKVMPTALEEENRLNGTEQEEDFAPMPTWQREAPERPNLNTAEMQDLDGVAVPVKETEQQRREAPERPTLNTAEMQDLDGVAVPARDKTGANDQEQKKAPNRPPLGQEQALFDNAPAAAASTEQSTQAEKSMGEIHGKIMEVTLDEDSGAAEARMEDGTKVALSDAGLTERQQTVAEEALGLPQRAQAAMAQALEETTDDEAVRDAARGFRKIYDMAARGINANRISSLYGDTLTAKQKQAAIEAGQQQYEATRAEDLKATRATAQRLKQNKGITFQVLDDGNANSGGVYLARVKGDVSNKAATMLQVIDQYARKKMLNVRVFDSLGDQNGEYVSGSNVVNVALDAEEGMLTRTVSHEFFHFIKEWNANEAARLQKLALDALQNTPGYDLEQRIADTQDQYRTEAGQELSREEAEEEIAAEAMLDQIGTEENLKNLLISENEEALTEAEKNGAQQEKKNLLQKITDWLKDTANKLREIMDRLAWNHPEVRALKDNVDYISRAAVMYETAIRNAVKNYQSTQVGLYSAAAQDQDVQAYQKAMENAFTDEDAQAERDALAVNLFMRAEKGWIEKHADLYEDGLEKFKQALREYGTGEKALNKALRDQGLEDAPQEMNAALAYAGRQMEEGDNAGNNIRKQLKVNNYEKIDKENLNNIKMRGDIAITTPEQLDDNIKKAITTDEQKQVYIGGIPENTKAKIEADTGWKIFKKGQYTFGILYDNIRHLHNRHYETVDEIKEAIGRTYDMVTNYDNVRAYTEHGQTRLEFTKGYPEADYLTINVASKSKRALETVTVYLTQKNEGKVSVHAAANNTDGLTQGSSLNNSVTQNETGVKKKSSLKAPARDRAYMEAIDSGDEEAAQRMVDEAAKEAGYNIHAYHGTARGDRVGNVFRPERATSGPMAYFTSDEEIAGNYARDKADTSIDYEEEYDGYYNQFRVRGKDGSTKPVQDLWNGLSYAQKQKITNAAKHITWDEDMENVVYDQNAQRGNGSFDNYMLREHNGNAIEALIDSWLESGELYGQESTFLEVLKLAGIDNAEYFNPDERHEKVYDVYLKINSPFDTAVRYTADFVNGMENWWKNQDQSKYRKESANADMWDKNNTTVEQWIEKAQDDLANGRTHAWTTIPDAVTDYLKSQGYDGIIDQGGKNGGPGHTVYIPFTGEQVKETAAVEYDDAGNVIPLSERFDTGKNDIRFSMKQKQITLPAMDIDPAHAFKYDDAAEEEAERKIAERIEEIKNIIQQRGMMGLEITKPSGSKEILTPSIRKGVKWQLSYIGYDGIPNMHENYGMTSKDHVDEAIETEEQLYRHFANMTFRQPLTMETLTDEPDENNSVQFSRRADTEDTISEAVLHDLRTDAEFYNQIMTDEETETAVRLFAKIYRSLESASADLVGKVTERENWKTRRTEIAKRLITETGSKMKLNDVADWVGRLFNALDKGGYNVGEALMYARELGMELIKKSPGMQLPMDETTKDVLNALKNNKFFLTDDQKSEIRGTYGNLQTYLRQMFGKTKIAKKAPGVSDLGTFWRETLTPMDPGTFAEDTSELDMPGILLAWLETANQPKYSEAFGQNAGHYATSIGLELMGEYLDMPWTNQRVNALKGQYDRELKAIRNNYQGKYEERVEKARLKRETAEQKNKTINEIKKIVRPIRTRVVNPTDSRHIPEELRGAAEAFLHIFDRDKAIFSGYEIQELANKYRLLAENGALHDTDAAGKYDKDIDAYLQWLSAKMKDGGPLRSRTQQELDMIKNVAEHIAFVFEKQTNKEINGRQVNLEKEADEFMAEMRSRKEARLGKLWEATRGLIYREITPVYYAKQVGGIVKEAIDDLIINGQQKYAFHVRDTKEQMDEMIKKHNVNSWINSKNHLQFDTVQGDHLELDKEQALTLYAWWKREQSNTLQNAAHLKLGGFTYDLKDKDTKNYKGVDLHKSHVLSQADMYKIEDYLGEEGKAFADEMIEYLSSTVSEWGNETSMALFGWKKYGEKNYFPYPTDAQFRGKNLAFGSKGQNAKLKNISASHALTENAHNPLKLGNFTDIWADHVDMMAMYNAFAEKLDNLERVTNYVNDGSTTINEDGTLKITSPESAKKLMAQAMGEEAVRYLEEFINDVNGGVRGDERGAGKKLFSLFKKGSVAANLSVMLQQPSAFVRAMSMVSPKYFVKGLNPKDLKGIKTRMYENSGAAVIKDMGRFDTNVGKSSVEWLTDAINNPSKLGAAYDIMDEWTGKGAELADEITWCWMYSAVENEVEDTTNLKPGTKEFNEAVGKRFDAVMAKTQVYDSTLAKSAWMRSTGTMDKMLTSFMAEPTLWANMLMDAALDVSQKKQGAGKKAAAAVGIFVGGSLVNALLKSLATALRRKNDEGRTYMEKYLAEVTGNFIEDVSPFGVLNMIPLARDFVSIAQGYDVERADMTLVSDLVNKTKKVVNNGTEATVEDWINLGTAAANIFGIPARNLYRDLKGLWGAFFGGANASGPNEGRDIWLSILDNVGDTLKVMNITPYDSGNKAYYDRMEQALLSGDMDKYNKLRGYIEETLGTKEKTVTSGIKSAIRDSVQNGKIEDEKAIELLKMLDGDDADEIDAYFQIKEWKQEKAHEDDEEYSYSRFEDVFDAVKTGQSIAQASKDLLDHEYSQDEIDSKILSQIGDWYKKGEISKEEATRKLKQYNSMDDADDLYFQFQKWEYEKTKGKRAPAYNRFMKVYDAVDNETSMTNAMKELIIHGYTEEQVQSKIKSHIGEMYLEGDITKAQGTAKLKKYAGITDSDDLHWVFDEWDYNAGKGKKDPDYNRYIDVYNAVDKGKSINTAMLEMTQNGYEEKDVKSAIKSHIGEQYREGTLNRSNAESKLKQYTGIIDANDLYWIFDEWDYKKKNANNKNAPKYSRYLKHDNAVKNGSNLTEETNRLLNHGVKKDTISSHITSTFKPEYVALVKAGRTAEADQMMQRLLRAYEVLGYERSKKRKDIEKWLK